MANAATEFHPFLEQLFREWKIHQGPLFRHYRELVKPDKAEKYWNIRPAGAGEPGGDEPTNRLILPLGVATLIKA